jgi:hypothetical protein
MKKVKILTGSAILLMILATTVFGAEEKELEKYIENYTITAGEKTIFENSVLQKTTKEGKDFSLISTTVQEDWENQKEVSESKTATMQTTDTEALNRAFLQEIPYDDGIYKGTLKLSNIDIQKQNNGYHEELDEEVIAFQGYDQNELNNIPKNRRINGKEYVLINVDWRVEQTAIVDGINVPITYQGTQHYQSVVSVKNIDSYIVNVSYKGIVDKNNKVYHYVLTYEEIPIKPDYTVQIVIIAGGVGLLVLLLLLNKNTKVANLQQNGVYRIIYKTNLSKNKLKIDLTRKFYKCETNSFKFALKKGIFEKLKGQTIEVNLNGKITPILVVSSEFVVQL